MARWLSALLIFVLFLSFLSCTKKDAPKLIQNSSGLTYFSIIDFTKDQWRTFHGQPVMLEQTISLNGKSDTSLVSALTMKWSAVFSVFFETDISNPKFLDQYDCSAFDENTTQSRTYTYIAKDPKQYTQKLQVMVDAYTQRIRNIYIETQKQTFWNTQTKKLLYSPMHLLQIQEHNNPLIGGEKDLVILYKFL